MNKDNSKPTGFYCPHEHKMCDLVEHCVYRAHDGGCGLRQATFRKLGTLKRLQQTLYKIGEWLVKIWRVDEHADR